MLKRRTFGTMVAMLALAVLLAACGGNTDDEQAADTDASTDGPREIHIVLDDFTFEPQDIIVKAGEVVKIVLENKGSVAHDWNVETVRIRSPLIQPGQTASFEFTAGEAGVYEAYCAEPGHRGLGMVGQLIIEDA